MKNLTIEHLAPYLPYGLYCNFIGNDDIAHIGELTTISTKAEYENVSFITEANHIDYASMIEIQDVKPILHPLSDLTKEIEHNGERFMPIQKLAKAYGGSLSHLNDEGLNIANKKLVNDITNQELSYKLYQKLFEWHFDSYGLIEDGLAIDVNQL